MSTSYVISITGSFNDLSGDTFKIKGLECIDKSKTKVNNIQHKSYTYKCDQNSIIFIIKEIKKIIKNKESLCIDGVFLFGETDKGYKCETIYSSEDALKTWLSPIQVENYRKSIESYDKETKEIYDLIVT